MAYVNLNVERCSSFAHHIRNVEDKNLITSPKWLLEYIIIFFTGGLVERELSKQYDNFIQAMTHSIEENNADLNSYHLPDKRFTGATLLTGALISRLESRPSSGTSANSAATVMAPTPLMLLSRSESSLKVVADRNLISSSIRASLSEQEERPSVKKVTFAVLSQALLNTDPYGAQSLQVLIYSTKPKAPASSS